MSIRMKWGISPCADVYESSFKDGDMTALVRIRGEAVLQAHARGPRAVFDMVMHEVQGALNALAARKERRPLVGQAIHAPGIEGMSFITKIDRSTDPNRVYVGNDYQPVDWLACKYPDEMH